jgi:transcriptional regulator with XRE-family HTH domain
MLTTTPHLADSRSADLRSRRHALGLSAAQLAALTGYSPAHITQLEEGYRPKRGNAVAEIVEALERAEAELNDHGAAANGPVGKAGNDDARQTA